MCVCAVTEGQRMANRKTHSDVGTKRGNKYIKTNTERGEKERERKR